MPKESCIVDHFQQVERLNEQEIELLIALEKDLQDFPADAILSNDGQESGQLFTLQSGWAYAGRHLSDGRRQVLDIFLPGQIMGLRDIGFLRTRTDLIALTEVRACPFPAAYLDDVFERSSRIARIFFKMAVRDHALLTERIVNIARQCAAQRVAHFLLEMKVRLRAPEAEFDLPLKQSIMADALGISAVHMSRTLTQLREEHLVQIDNHRVTILNLPDLIGRAEFDPAYLESFQKND
jgi:CRP-like cAMP-binding protein